MITTATQPAPRIAQPPKPGIYRNIPADVYHRWDAVSASRLKKLSRSAAHLRWSLDHPDDDDSDALTLGRCYHDAILLPHEFETSYMVAQPCRATLSSGGRKGEPCGKSGSYLAEDGWYCGTHAPEHATTPPNTIDAADYETARRIRDKVHSHAAARELFCCEGLNEASIVWTDPITGLPCKARIDRYNRNSIHVDLKGTRDASLYAFAKEIHNFGYHIQAGHYLDGATVLRPGERRFVFVAVEKTPPYCIGVYQLEPDAVEQGQREARNLMATYKTCLESNQWPDYTHDGIGWISLPSYAFTPDIE